MENIGDEIKKATKRYNVNVDNNLSNNVYVDVADIEKINEASDKHKAIGEILVEKLGKPNNLELYIKLSYLNPATSLFEWSSIARDAFKDGKTKDQGGYFYGIVRNLGRVK
jgi:hypothetical protein